MTSHRFDVFNTNVKILVNFPRKTTDHQQTTNQSGIYRNKPKSRNETTNTTLTSLTHQDPCQNKPDQDQEKLPPLTTIVSDHFCLTSRCPPLAWRPRGRPLQVSHGRVSDGSSVGFMTGSSTSRRIDNESTMERQAKSNPNNKVGPGTAVPPFPLERIRFRYELVSGPNSLGGSGPRRSEDVDSSSK